MIEFELIDDSQTIDVNLIDDTENIEVDLIKEIDKYSDLKELPSINDVTLIGNKTLHELEIQPEGDYATNTELNSGLATKVDKVTGKGLSTNDYTNEEKQKLSTLENYDDTEVRELIDTKQPRGNYLTEETDPTVPNHVKTITQSNIAYWNNKADKSEIPDVSNFAIKTELNSEATNRENADLGLQEQIDAITSSSDVKDIVGTYAELQNYDTSTLGNDDIIKVLQDSTHNEAMTYYRWVISGSSESWQYIGQEGPYYTKSETETLLNNKQNEITSSNKLDSDLVNDENQTNKFVTASNITTWNNKYTKPSGGIPKTDLASEVQTSLGKADTALQSSDLTNYVTNTDYATSVTGGVVKTGYSINVDTNGNLYVESKSYSDYDSMGSNNAISKGTLENVITGRALENKYSRSEIKTGTWIDNKPVYRRIFTIDLGAASNIAQAHSLTNLDKFWINQSASFVFSSYESLPSTWYYSSTDWARTWMTNTSIRFRSPVDLTNRVLWVAVEYTKTTD